MKTQLLVNEMIIPLDEFTQAYIGNILKGIAASMGCPGEKIVMNMDMNGVNLYSENSDVHVESEVHRSLVESTVKGMLSPVRGVVLVERVTLTTSG